MNRYDRRTKVLAACLSAVAGCVDAIGYIHLHGFFVSFMSGNSTRLAVTAARGDAPAALEALGLVALFVSGVVLGTVTGSLAPRRRRRSVLLLVSALLVAAASFGLAAYKTPAIVAMTLAMGAENAVVERDGEVHIGLTYMTGTLVKFGQRLAAAFQGGERFGWLPFLGLWLGLVSGALAGALAYPVFGFATLYAAGCATLVLALALSRP